MDGQRQSIPEWAQDIRERIVRIETKLDQWSTVVDTTFKALALAQQLEKDVRDLQDDRKRLWWAVATALIAGGINLLIRHGGGG